MSIEDYRGKIKSRIAELRERWTGGEDYSRYYTAAVVVLVGLSSFGLGRLSILDENREPISIENSEAVEEKTPPTAAVGGAETQSASVASSVNGQLSNGTSLAKGAAPLTATTGKIVASKNGTKYYFSWCSNNIAEKNKIWFNSEAEARARGLQPAANCKGLK